MPRPSSVRALSRLRNPAEAFYLAQCVLFAATVPFLARLRLPLLGRLLALLPEPSSPSGDFDRIVQNVTRALRYGQPIVRRGCMTRGLTLYYFLRRAGVRVRLCFGARFRLGVFEAHCWLERAGQPFLEEPGDPGCPFLPFYTFPQGETE